MHIRFATSEDLARIIAIYNQAVRAGNTIAFTEPLVVSDRVAWFNGHSPNDYPLYVLEMEQQVVAWASLSAYRKGRTALRATAEISYYIDYEYHRQGFGRKIIEYVIADCPRLGLQHLFALLIELNVASVGILEAFDFERWGYLPHIVALPDGQTCAHLIYGRNLLQTG